MAYVTPGTVAAGDVATAAAWNVLTNDVIAHQASLVNVVQGTTVTAVTSSSSTYGDIGLSVIITPAFITSKVLVTVFIQFYKVNNTGANFKILRGATKLTENQYLGYTNSAVENHEMFSIAYLDSPATTSATTYKVQCASQSNIATIGVSPFGASSPSFITVQEIPA